MPDIQVIHADSLEYLRTLPSNSLHACVTDPPYGLGDPPDPAEVLQQWAILGDWTPSKGKGKGFMGASWDRFVPGVALWREVHRVLRPGAYLASFAGTRMWDWMSLGLRFSGFEIVDTLMWLYGEGWPKGGDVGKRIDQMLGATRQTLGPREGQCCPFLLRGEACLCSADGEQSQAGRTVHQPQSLPATPEAEAWHDCSTTLKPAWEPILLAQKPWEKSAAANCMKWGTGAMRTGACRIPADGADQQEMLRATSPGSSYRGARNVFGNNFNNKDPNYDPSRGRWPANVIWSHHPSCREVCVPGCPVRDLDIQTGTLKFRGNQKTSSSTRAPMMKGQTQARDTGETFNYDQGGGPSRFYYCGKAYASDENEGLPRGITNEHPTVKPTHLMRWLVRLLTPPGGTLLDPFAGSGTTGKAAALEGLDAILIERELEHHVVATHRVRHAIQQYEDQTFGFQ